MHLCAMVRCKWQMTPFFVSSRSTYLAVVLNTRSIGTRPLLVPLVPFMRVPFARTLLMSIPIPPADLLMRAISFSVSYMASMLSSFMDMRKHDANWCCFIPELKRVGEACVYQPSEMILYISMASSGVSVKKTATHQKILVFRQYHLYPLINTTVEGSRP